MTNDERAALAANALVGVVDIDRTFEHWNDEAEYQRECETERRFGA